MADIFISYKKERRAHAERLAVILEAYGYEVWWDYDLAVGPDFRNQIEAKLEVAKVVIVLWCSGAVQSKFVRSEANRADKRGKLVQAYLEWVEPPLGFEEAQGQPLVNWRGEPEGEVLAGLLAALADRLGVQPRAENMIRFLANSPPLSQVEPMPVIEKEEMDVEQNGAPSMMSGVRHSTPHQERPAAARWALIEKSLDIRDYDDFQRVFAIEPEAFDAARQRRQLEDWSEIDHKSSRAVESFLNDPAKGANLFEALDAHVQLTMRRAADAERKAEEERTAAEAAKAEAKRKAEDERKAAEEERRLAPKRAAEAAKAEGPVADRTFRLELPSVPDWPAPEMVAIPPGRFLMGSPEAEAERLSHEGPQHEVHIAYAFAMGKHTVTFAEWDAANADGAGLSVPEDNGWGRQTRPVIKVSWDDAQAYIAWLNGRLGLVGREDAWRFPSEAEWEYACRAGTATAYTFGDTISKKQAQFSEGLMASANQTVPVGSFPANAFGLHDMHGNVWEWVEDCYVNSYSGAPSDGSAFTERSRSDRVLRGGSWMVHPFYLHSAMRNWNTPGERNYNAGFRIARTLP